jgi:hypothetical protein
MHFFAVVWRYLTQGPKPVVTFRSKADCFIKVWRIRLPLVTILMLQHNEVFFIVRVKQEMTDRSWVHFLAEPSQGGIFISI